MTTTNTTTTEQMALDLENYATVTARADGSLRISCRDDLCGEIEQTCEGAGWSVRWAGESATDGRDGRTYEDGTVSRD